ncbi:MAG: glycosyltransferase family 4 protein [Candidatus Edwardsbacteria bacterium]|nr:glycosyltransferase family 4 protein [Candidatus Edwardsbacteria bacterium]
MDDRRPRIAIVNDQPRSSGTGTYAWQLAGLAARAQRIAADHVFLDYPGRRVVRDPGTEGEAVAARIARIPLLDNRPWFWRRCLRHLRGYGVVHLTSQNMSFLCGAVPGRTVVTCLDIIPLIAPEAPLERQWRGYLYSGLRRADRLIAISAATKRDVMRHCGIAADRIDVVPLGVDERYRPGDKATVRRQPHLPGDRPIILHVGTAAARKRVPLLLGAFARARSCRDALLVRIGKATPEHRALARRLGIQQRVLFLENIAADALPSYYGAADLFVFPSRHEGFGLPPLEAMASGCPVIAADNSSIPEVVGDAGVLVASDDPQRWAEEIDRVLDDPALAKDLARRGVERAASFTWEKTFKLTEKIYCRVARS